MKMQVIAQNCWHDACGTVCRCSHNPAAGCIFLIDGHGIDRQPIIRQKRVAAVVAPIVLQLVVKLSRTTANIQTTGHHTITAQAALDTAAHGSPNAIKTAVQITARHMFFFVSPFHFGNRQPAVVSHLKHFSGTAERKRHIGLIVRFAPLR